MGTVQCVISSSSVRRKTQEVDMENPNGEGLICDDCGRQGRQGMGIFSGYRGLLIHPGQGGDFCNSCLRRRRYYYDRWRDSMLAPSVVKKFWLLLLQSPHTLSEGEIKTLSKPEFLDRLFHAVRMVTGGYEEVLRYRGRKAWLGKLPTQELQERYDRGRKDRVAAIEEDDMVGLPDPFFELPPLAALDLDLCIMHELLIERAAEEEAKTP